MGKSSVYRNIPRKGMLKLKSQPFSLVSKASAHPSRDHSDSRWSLHLSEPEQVLKILSKLLTGNLSSENCLLRLASK